MTPTKAYKKRIGAIRNEDMFTVLRLRNEYLPEGKDSIFKTYETNNAHGAPLSVFCFHTLSGLGVILPVYCMSDQCCGMRNNYPQFSGLF